MNMLRYGLALAKRAPRWSGQRASVSIAARIASSRSLIADAGYCSERCATKARVRRWRKRSQQS